MDNTELRDFVLDEAVENKEDYTVVSSTEELDNFDFTSDKEFNIDEYHELVATLKEEEEQDESMKELVKLREAKNIIEQNAKTFLDPVFVDKWNQEEQNLINMIKKFDPNIDSVRALSEQQKDKIYEIAQYLFNSFQKKLNDITFSFPLTNDERKFIFNVFKNKLEYDQNEVFQLKDIKTNYLDVDFKKGEDGNYMTFINVNDLIIFYHLISKYKVKGITQEHYDFLQILTKIGERIKLFNAYNVVVQRLSTDFQMWGGALDVEGELVGKTLDPSIVEKNSENKKFQSNETQEVINVVGDNGIFYSLSNGTNIKKDIFFQKYSEFKDDVVLIEETGEVVVK
jgi:hypothetical protein